MDMKICRICNVSQELKHYHLRKSSKDGRRSECIECTKIIKKDWRNNNKPKIAQYAKKYADLHSEKLKLLRKTTRQKARVLNPEKFKTEYKAWYSANKEKAKQSTEQWKAKNPSWYQNYYIRKKEHIQEYRKKWAQNNIALVRNKTRHYQMLKRKASPCWLTAIQKAQIQEMYDVAVALEMQTGIPHHVDHIHPLNSKDLCGLHVPWNLQVITRKANIAKSNKLVGEL